MDRIGADRGMLGEIFVVRPTYVVGATGPATVICKFAALRDGVLASARRGRTHERELRCYDELLSATAVSTPGFHAAWYDPDTAHFLLVQSAIAADTSIDQVAGIDAELVAMVGAEAATLHHQFWKSSVLADLEWLPRLDDPLRIGNLTTLAATGWGPLCDLVDTEFPPAERRLGDELPERLEAALRTLASLPSTLIHSDLRTDNLLFSEDRTSVTLVDWQGAGIGPGSFDMAYLISQSMTVTDRRAHEADLVAGYLAQLEASGTAQSNDDFMTGYALAHHYGLTIACALPLISDASQARVARLATAMARRSIEALRDHGQLWT